MAWFVLLLGAMNTKSVLKVLSVFTTTILLAACGSGQPPIQGSNVYQQGYNSMGTCYNQYGQPYACNQGVQTNNPWAVSGQQIPLTVQSQIQWIDGNSFRFDLGQVNAGDRITFYGQNGIYLYKQCYPTGGFNVYVNVGNQSPYAPVMGAQLKVNGQLLTTVYGPAQVQQSGNLTLEGTAVGFSQTCSGGSGAYITVVSGSGASIGYLQR